MAEPAVAVGKVWSQKLHVPRLVWDSLQMQSGDRVEWFLTEDGFRVRIARLAERNVEAVRSPNRRSAPPAG